MTEEYLLSFENSVNPVCWVSAINAVSSDEPYLITFEHCIFSSKAERDLPKLASNGTNYLYTTEYNYVDFNVDDNGLWVIYTSADSNNTIVAKVRFLSTYVSPIKLTH